MMRFDVRLEIARERERLVAHVTRKRLIARMRQQMVLEIGVLGEAALAQLAPERPRALVRVHVTAQIARRRK